MVPPAHRAFIHNLPAVIEGDDFFVVHGKWNVRTSPDRPALGQQLAADHAKRWLVMWGRFETEEILAGKSWRRTGYFGHTPVSNYPELLKYGQLYPVRADKIVLLDTALVMRQDGRLTAWCHEAQSFIQADRAGNVLSMV